MAHVLEREHVAAVEQGLDAVGQRPPRADDRVRARRARELESVLPEHGVGVGVAALGDGGEHGVVDGGAGERHPVSHRGLAPRGGCARVS